MWNAVKMQMQVLLSRKSTLFSYFFMHVLVFANFIMNIKAYYGYDVSQMYNANKILLLADGSSIVGYYFMLFYPFFLVLPAAFSYMADAQSREIVFIQARSARRVYYIGKAAAVFLVTFLVFVIPLLLELVLNAAAFPNAMGDPYHNDVFTPSYNEVIQRWFFWKLWVKNQYAYIVLWCICFGAISGILAVFAMAVSTFRWFKFKIFIFIPVYAFFWILAALGQFCGIEVSAYYADYLRMFDISIKSWGSVPLLMAAVLFFSIMILVFKARKDELA